jgi:hypothetical protein
MSDKSQDFILEVIKTLATMVIPIIMLLRSRVDLDRYIATRRAKENGQPVSDVIRKRWYHSLKGSRERSGAEKQS